MATIKEFPYSMTITKTIIDDSVYPPTSSTVTILSTICDISAPSDSKSDGVLTADYSVWIPKTIVLPKLQRGTTCEIEFNIADKRTVTIVNVYPGQLGHRIDVKEVDN
jgi:hypothetical protein